MVENHIDEIWKNISLEEKTTILQKAGYSSEKADEIWEDIDSGFKYDILRENGYKPSFILEEINFPEELDFKSYPF